MANISTSIYGIDFPNPVMPAAGPNVKSAKVMIKAAEEGAGAIVSKTFSVKAANDPRPTMKKTGKGGLLNCETWLEEEYDKFMPVLKEVKNNIKVPFIVSIGYSSSDVDFLGRLLEKEIAPDAIEFSTHYTGSSIKPLIEVAESLKKAVSMPVLMKLSPGFPALEELVKEADSIVDGFVAVNSLGPALDFDPVKCKPSLGSAWGQGWMSGSPILPIALAVVYRISQIVTKPILGVGGISTGEDAIKFLMAGASAVQLCTAAIAGGPSAYGRVAQEISAWLDENGYDNLKEIKGKYLKNFE